MDFDLSPEQAMLGDVARRFVAGHYAFETRRAILSSAAGWSREVWRRLADLGLTALLVPADHGGGGGGPVETMVVMEAFGGAMVLEPFWSSAVLATQIVCRLGGEAADRLLARMATGECIAAVAHAEPGSRYAGLAPAAVAGTVAKRTGPGWTLTGDKSVVLHAGAADVLLVSARLAGGGVSVFAVPRGTHGVTLRRYRTIDGRDAADVRLADVALAGDALLGGEGLGATAIDGAHDVALAALCADSVGAMKALFEATREHLLTRRQFGRPIGEFQVLRHRIADMLLHYEQARSMSILAALKCESVDAEARRRTLSAAKVIVGQAGRFIGQQAIQLHGGMGMSDEFQVGHLFKRLTAAEILLGDTEHHVQRFIALDPHEVAVGPL